MRLGLGHLGKHFPFLSLENGPSAHCKVSCNLQATLGEDQPGYKPQEKHNKGDLHPGQGHGHTEPERTEIPGIEGGSAQGPGNPAELSPLGQLGVWTETTWGVSPAGSCDNKNNPAGTRGGNSVNKSLGA